MKRRLASLVHPMATRLALLFLVLFQASCSKDQVPVAPNHVVNGSKSAPSASGTLASEGILRFVQNVPPSGFLNANDLVLVNVLVMPAVGSYEARWYCLVRTEDGSSFADKAIEKDFQSAQELTWWSPNEAVRSSVDDITSPDRDGLTFDDHHTFSSGTEYMSQPAFSQIGLMEARTISEGSGTVIALLDTGVDPTHNLLQSATIVSAGNYTTMPPTGGSLDQPASPTDNVDGDGDGYVNDGVGHGTHVAGLIYTGARQATIRVYKVLDDEGQGSTFGLAKAIRAATIAGVDIINCSLGFLDGEGNEMVEHVVADAQAEGIVIVASAGNRNDDTEQYPAAYPGVISVTAVDQYDVRFLRGSYGSSVDICAPGVEVVSAISSYWGPNKYAKGSGSSAAVPWVSAAIAVTQVGRLITTAEAATIVLQTTDDISTQNPEIPVPGRLDMAAAAGYGLLE
jgi:subtilisin family serine protease